MAHPKSMLTALVFSAFVAAAVPADQALHVAPLPRDGQVLVSFTLAHELTDEIREKIHSGLLVSFTYKVELRRSSAIWFSRTLASSVVTATVRYDNLTRRYHVTRALDGRMDRAETTPSEEVAWAWLTSEFERLPLFSSVTLERNAEYYVRVRARAAPGGSSFVWPWHGDDVIGSMKFTLIR
jgi:hypothetical protein